MSDGPATGNPWQRIPLADYEAHMALPQVDQARLLAQVFGSALDRYAPRSVALLGCAGGNGFEQAAAHPLERVVGIDINADYLAQARARWAARINGLELLDGDLQADRFDFPAVDLVFAALLFEYVDVGRVLGRIRPMLRPGGALVTVLQQPDPRMPAIMPSPYASLAALAPILRLVPAGQLAEAAGQLGYQPLNRTTITSTAGKRFCVQDFRRP